MTGRGIPQIGATVVIPDRQENAAWAERHGRQVGASIWVTQRPQLPARRGIPQECSAVLVTGRQDLAVRPIREGGDVALARIKEAPEQATCPGIARPPS